MKKNRVVKAALASCVVLAIAIGVGALISSKVEARPGVVLLCGPTYQWSCSGPGGPDVLFIGTVCDKFRFERKTGLTCTPI